MRLHRTMFLLLAAPACGALLAGACAESPAPVPAQARPAAVPAESGPAPSVAPTAEDAQKTPDADFRKQPPPAGPEPAFKVPSVRRFKLKNGLAVVLSEVHDLPIIDFNLIIKAGGAANPPGLPGLADMTANMLDEGAAKRSAIQIAEDVAQLGASLGTGSSWDSTGVSLACLGRNVDAALDIWADVVLHPSFDDKEFTRVRDNLVTSLASRKDSPPAVASVTMNRVLYPDAHPFSSPGNGTEDSLKKMTVKDIKKFYDTYYRPGIATLVVAGDITEADLKAKLEARLKGWKQKPVTLPALPAVEQHARRRIYLVDKAGAPQSSIRVSLVGIERNNPDYFAAVMANTILGGSFMRLDMKLREEKAWTYGARSGFEPRRARGPWNAGGEFVAEHTADAVKEILAQIEGMRTAEVTADELKKAKDQVVKAFPARFSTRGGIAGSLAELVVYDLPDTYFDSYAGKFAAVTAAELRAAAQKYFSTDKLAVIVVGNAKANEAPLKDIAEVEWRDVEGRPVSAPARPGK